MADRGVANSPLLIEFHNEVTLGLSLHCKLHLVLKLSRKRNCCNVCAMRNHERDRARFGQAVRIRQSEESFTPEKYWRVCCLVAGNTATFFLFFFHCVHTKRVLESFMHRNTFHERTTIFSGEILYWVNLMPFPSPCHWLMEKNAYAFCFVLHRKLIWWSLVLPKIVVIARLLWCLLRLLKIHRSSICKTVI